MKRVLEIIVGLSEGIEFVILPCLLVALGPLVWLYKLASAHRFGSAAIVALFWFASLGIIGHEVRKKAITAISFAVFLAWLVVLVFVFHDFFT